MTREKMLEQMGIKDEDFRDYLGKYCSFLNSLKHKQREFHYDHAGRSTVEEVTRSLGPDVTAEDIKDLFAECPPIEGILFARCCGR